MKKTFTFILTLTVLIFGNVNAETTSFGDQIWNVYCSKDSAVAGSYTENTLSFNSSNRWINTPANANTASGNAYTGNAALGNSFTVSYKRKGFTAGVYELEVITDNNASLYVNGILVWDNTSNNVWTGMLNDTTTVEFKWATNGSASAAIVNFIPVSEEETTTEIQGSIDNNTENKLVVYPNPAVSGEALFVTIADQSNDVVITMVDMKGQAHFSRTLAATENHESVEINASTLEAGVYVVIATSENGTSSQKFLVQ